MAHIYGGWLLNIAGAASNDCTGGLFQKRPSSYLGPCLISVETQNEVSISWYQLWDQNLWYAEFETARLNRAPGYCKDACYHRAHLPLPRHSCHVYIPLIPMEY